MASTVLPTPVEVRPGTRTQISDLLSGLLRWRSDPGFGRLEAIVLAVYAAIVAAVIPFHEPWSDEAQAWLIGRDLSWWQIFRHRLHYEGAPPLWHSLIRLLHVLHVPWAAFPWVAAGFAVAGMYVFLRWSPFPAIIRAILPFTFFVLYQYAVIARPYVLFPLLLFSVCAVYTAKRARPMPFAVAAGLLACLSMQGFLLSAVLSGFFLWKISPWRKERRGWESMPSSRSLVLPGAVLLVMWAVAAYPAIPAPDVDFAVTSQVSTGAMHDLLVKWIGVTPRLPDAVMPEDFVPPIHPGRKPMAKPSFFRSPAQWIAWQNNERPIRSPIDDAIHSALDGLLCVMSQATWPVSTSNLLACAFLLSACVWMRGRRQLLMLVPWVALLCLGAILWVADHHGGMLLVTLVACLWLAGGQSSPSMGRPRVERTFLGLFAAVLLLQVVWSAVSIRREIYGSYDPGRETAQFLLQNHRGARMAGFHFYTVALQPYYASNPFFNQLTTYWGWNWSNDTDPHHWEAIAQHPDVVVFTREITGTSPMRNQWAPLNPVIEEPPDIILDDLAAKGYLETHRFCGDRFSRMGSSYRVCNLIFEPGGRPADYAAADGSRPSLGAVR